MDKRNYIDIHCHPSFKSLFKNPENRWNNWKGLELSDVHSSKILVSQSSLAQVSQSSNLVCVPLHPVEPGMVKNIFLRIADLFFKALDSRRLKNIVRNRTSSYNLLTEELINLNDPDPAGTKRVKILRKISDYDPSDINTVHIILAIEGPHAFYGEGNADDDPEGIIAVFEKWVSMGYLVLYCSLTHMTYNIFANHAYGNKILPKKYMLPVGKGLRTKYSYTLIDKIYNNNLVVDVKHMSLIARLDFYKYHRAKYHDKPIIFSHGGVTGFSLTEILGEYAEKKTHQVGIELRKDTVKIVYNYYYDPVRNMPYYPTSINLYDEEIVTIIRSKGLICLELDERILGNDKGNKPKEFVSPEEYALWRKDFSKNLDSIRNLITDNSDINYKITIEDAAEELENFRTFIGAESEKEIYQEKEKMNGGYFEKLFINQLLHIYDVVGGTPELEGINVWDHISIGSDFDGLIETIPSCTNAGKTDYFADRLEREFGNIINQFSLVLSEPTTSIINKIFRLNALEFIQKQFPA